MKQFPILPMLNQAEQIIIVSLKKNRRNANCMSTYMFSDTGNTMEDDFFRSSGRVQDGVNPTSSRSSEPTCSYSTIIYVAEHAERHDLTPVITFDQPLWWKPLAIQLSQPEGSSIRRLILILGAFHMEMSFLGSIDHLMAGSGIKELFEII